MTISDYAQESILLITVDEFVPWRQQKTVVLVMLMPKQLYI